MAASILAGLSSAQLRRVIEGLEQESDTAATDRARTALIQALAGLNIPR